jgi:hypothetical protein
MGGLTSYIAVCMTCKKVIRPLRTRFSRSGTHGTEYYVHEHPLVFIELNQSNSGNRSIVVPKELEEIKADLERMWIYESCYVSDIKNYVETYLKTLNLVQNLAQKKG